MRVICSQVLSISRLSNMEYRKRILSEKLKVTADQISLVVRAPGSIAGIATQRQELQLGQPAHSWRLVSIRYAGPHVPPQICTLGLHFPTVAAGRASVAEPSPWPRLDSAMSHLARPGLAADSTAGHNPVRHRHHHLTFTIVSSRLVLTIIPKTRPLSKAITNLQPQP